MELFKTLSNVSGLETLDLTLGATLDLRNPFGRLRHTVIIQSPQVRKPLDQMRVHAGDDQTYLVRVDSVS